LKKQPDRETLPVRLFRIPLCGVDGGDQEAADGAALVVKRGGRVSAEDIGAHKQLQPVFRFIALFQSDLQFGNKIGFAVGIVCLMNIGSDRSCGAFQLIHNGMMTFDRFAELDDLNGKVHG